ncbi:hypothetical protein [Cupriavidus pampae]|nr:hypothetical protein [Cupriavidus pampae]
MDLLMLMLAATYAQPSPGSHDSQRANIQSCMKALTNPANGRTLAERCATHVDDPIASYAAARTCARRLPPPFTTAGARTRRHADACAVRVQLIIALYRLLTHNNWDMDAFGARIERISLGHSSNLHGKWTQGFESAVLDHARSGGESWLLQLNHAFRYAALVAAGLHVSVPGAAPSRASATPTTAPTTTTVSTPPAAPLPIWPFNAPRDYGHTVRGPRQMHGVRPLVVNADGTHVPLTNIQFELIHFEEDEAQEWQMRASPRDWRAVAAVATRWQERYAQAEADAALPANVRNIARAARWHAYIVREQIAVHDPSEVYIHFTRDGASIAILRATVSEDPDADNTSRDSIIEDILIAPEYALALPDQARLVDIDSFAIQTYLDSAYQDRHRTVTIPAISIADAMLAYRNGFTLQPDATDVPDQAPAVKRARHDDEL